MLEGTGVSLRVLAPTLADPLSSTIRRTVDSASVEIGDVSAFKLPTSGLDIVAASFDLTDSSIRYTITDPFYRGFADVDDASGFNGYSIDFDGLGPGTSLFRVDIVRGSNSLGLAARDIRFTDDRLRINVDGLGFEQGDGFDLLLGFRVVGGAGADLLDGGDGRDNIVGRSGSDTVLGRGGADTILGDGGNDRLYGQAGRDSISGGLGSDRMSGGTGRDSLQGGGGNDLLSGDEGSDSLTGGDGADRFVFTAGRDVVADFRNNVDAIAIDRDLLDPGRRSVQALLADHADVSGGDVLLSFGGGDALRIRDVTRLQSLADDLILI